MVSNQPPQYWESRVDTPVFNSMYNTLLELELEILQNSGNPGIAFALEARHAQLVSNATHYKTFMFRIKVPVWVK
jgi:hypothetical protein